LANAGSLTRKANCVTVKPISSMIRTRPDSRPEIAISPESRPVSVAAAPNSHTSSRIHVGASASARSSLRSEK
jgi:hypothetical protein